MTRHDLGTFAEHHFVAQAARRGFKGALAPGGCKGYDVVLDTGSGLFRVQVKAATSHKTLGRDHYSILIGRNGQLSSGASHFHAFWLDSHDRWVFRPTSELRGLKTFSVTIGSKGPRGGNPRQKHVFDDWSIFCV